jgi:uncharacterized protein
MSESAPPQPPAGGPTAGPTAPAPLSDSEVRQWAGFAHLGGILGFLPALLIWAIYKDRSAFVAQESRTALNFQITALIGYVAASVIGTVIPIGGLLWLAVWVTAIVLSVQGFQAVNRGQSYRYPFSLELVK